MNQRVKELWVAALRSGKYTQSRNALRTVSGYCCLGVLCDIAAKETDMGEWVNTVHGWKFVPKDRQYGSTSDILASPVMEWAGLTKRNPDTKDGSLAYNNDHGKSFLEIADMIEAEL
jgi:hypothetical protein